MYVALALTVVGCPLLKLIHSLSHVNFTHVHTVQCSQLQGGPVSTVHGALIVLYMSYN